MTMRPAGGTPAGPLSAEVPWPPERPPWRPPWQPSPAPSPVPPFTLAPLYNPVRNLPDLPGRHGHPAPPWLRETHERPSIDDRLLERRIVMAHGQLDDEAATRLCAQLLTLDAEGDEPIRFELQNLNAELSAALTVMGVLDVVGVPVQARAAGQISGPALGVLAACGRRGAYPNAVFVLSEPTVEFDGTMMAITAREEQIRTMLDALYIRLAEVTGREVDEIRADARAHRTLTAAEAQRYGLLTAQIERGRAPRPPGPASSRPQSPSPGASRPPGQGAPRPQGLWPPRPQDR
jgi:ATP-dependent Clp protease, protease subunit